MSPGSTGERNVTVSSIPPPAKVNIERVGVTSSRVCCSANGKSWTVVGVP
jgi:hypothetical protein